MHRRLDDTTGKLLQISTRFTQLELGVSSTFWTINYNKYQHYITETWTTDIWRYLDSCGMKMKDDDFWSYQPPQERDFFLMDEVLRTNLSTFQKQVFNQIRLFMKVITAGDLFIAGTTTLKKNVIGCTKPMKSKFGFPNIKPFPKKWQSIWNSIILTVILPRVQNNSLGRWVTTSHLHTDNTLSQTQPSTASSYKLAAQSIQITSPKFREAVTHIWKNIDNSPKWLRHIWGKSKLSPKCLQRILSLAKSEQLVIATDASVDEGHAAHGFCFSMKHRADVIFSSGSKVEGPPKTLSSYRAEMISIIAAVTLLDTILSTVGLINCKLILYTDSETSITTSSNPKLNTLHYVISNDIDVALQLHHTMRTCKQNIILSHVHGHQDKNKKFHELTVPSQLNVLMDALSKKMADDTKHSPNIVIPFPAQKLYLTRDQPIIHDVQERLVTMEMKKEIKTYYEKHHDVPALSLNSIDWDATKSGLLTKNAISFLKTFHNFRNTMSINKKWGRIESDTCPLCKQEPETLQHLLSCTHQDIRYVRDIQIQKIFKTLGELNTNPDMLSHWKSILCNMTTNSTIHKPTLTMNPNNWLLIQAHLQQERIGWPSFVKGMIAIKWTNIQIAHYRNNPKDGENIHRWRRLVIQAFMTMFKEIWGTRCGFINAEKVLTEREMLKHRTYSFFQTNRHHVDSIPIIDRHLFQKSESYFFTSSREILVLWESRAKEAIRNLSKNDPTQPSVSFHALAPQQPIQQIPLPSISQRIQALGDFVMRAKRMRRKRKRMLTNNDPTWNKRLKRTHRLKTMQKRKAKQTHHKSTRLKKHKFGEELVLPEPTIPIPLDMSHIISSIRSERS